MSSPDYYRATNLAYEFLKELNITCMPISVFRMLHGFPKENVIIKTYEEIETLYDVSKENFLSRSEFGFTMKKCNQFIIAYNNDKCFETIKFTLAHEIGHIILGHENDEGINNQEANCFARNVLCPIHIIKFLQLHSFEEYMDFFQISEPMARVSINFQKTDLYHIDKELYSYFMDTIEYEYLGIPTNDMIQKEILSTTYNIMF